MSDDKTRKGFWDQPLSILPKDPFWWRQPSSINIVFSTLWLAWSIFAFVFVRKVLFGDGELAVSGVAALVIIAAVIAFTSLAKRRTIFRWGPK